ncbi:hypothetical protein [Bradyrhizobium sp. 174]|uniref:hypothetical protein n=1 Tax=Bradyrhizobium sp. 174 TaxID=2782645 RepID=UPI001FF70081|nr:hypothetical protein [Bradyrhizobium sp. 174]MCK1573905.1 hypothetical protein [Bradyrhizobium sp. 174]
MRLIIAFILVLLVSAGGLSAGGFCFGQHRFLSDREFIDAVMQDLMKGRGSYSMHSIDGKTRTEISGISYASKDEFNRDNPDCCSIVSFDPPRDSGPQFTLLDYVRGNAAKLVKVKYKDRWTEDGQPKTQIVEDYRGLTNCGEVNHARDYWWK